VIDALIWFGYDLCKGFGSSAWFWQRNRPTNLALARHDGKMRLYPYQYLYVYFNLRSDDLLCFGDGAGRDSDSGKSSVEHVR
jgi:hypothetical protein